ncbi:MAG: iron(III) transport system ATP-binding protein [Myxococcota bacterium]
MLDPVLNIDGLAHAFGTTPVLHNVSLSVASGELVSVLGPSGSGKTTLLRAVGGFAAPQQGRIVLAGQVVTDNGRIKVPTERRGLGIVFQDYGLFAHMTVAANVAFGLARSDKTRVTEMLQLVGLLDYASRRPAELSGGQQQRVALARALAPRPSLLLLDEPFANLDAALRHQLRDDLRQTLRRTDTAALLITHDRTEALSIADRVAVLVPERAGATIAQVGPPSQVYGQPVSAAVAQLTGEVTLIEGTARGETADSALGSVPLRSEATGPVHLVVRPEHLELELDPDGPATVRARQFLGATVALVVTTGSVEVRIEAPASSPAREGTRGHIRARQPLQALPSA